MDHLYVTLQEPQLEGQKGLGANTNRANRLNTLYKQNSRLDAVYATFVELSRLGRVL
ncbi:hypothetical protein ES703_01593 [subsurface metagenome]